jgi:tRNA nucleotidyltransferase (CCA-adding enzyme)
VSRPLPSAPPAVRWIARTLEGAGFETWAVGGAVRDVLLGHPSGDWDLTTRARPDEVRRLFRRTVPIGVEHGTVGVLTDDGVMFEVTTFRRDVETDGRHAVVAFADRIEEDLARRDFTLNAIAWHPLREELLDPFDGVGDLEAGVLRAVGEPEQRFAEDFLRVLRALRFAGRFELEIEDGTWTALRAATRYLPALSAERIREELIKVLDADPRPSGALDLYRTSGVVAALYPELEEVVRAASGLWAATLRTIDALPVRRPLLRLAALLRPLEARATAQVLTRLRLSNHQVDETARRAGAAPLPGAGAGEGEVRRWLARTGPERLAAVARLDLAAARTAGGDAGCREAAEVVAAWRRARAILRTRPPLRVGDLELDGRDLIGLGLRPGPAFGRILERLLDWVLEDPARNRKDLLEERALEEAAEGGASHG